MNEKKYVEIEISKIGLQFKNLLATFMVKNQGKYNKSILIELSILAGEFQYLILKSMPIEHEEKLKIVQVLGEALLNQVESFKTGIN